MLVIITRLVEPGSTQVVVDGKKLVIVAILKHKEPARSELVHVAG